MSELINDTIKDIAVNHGVSIGRDDPVLMLQTINERLLNESRKSQQEILAQFKEEIELISSQWKDDAKEKAEKILNSSLSLGKEIMAKMLIESTNESISSIKRAVSDSLEETRVMSIQAQKYSRFSLIASTIIVSISVVFAAFSYLMK